MATILVIDDDPGVRGLVAAALASAGHGVVQAGDGAVVLEALLPADLVLLDVFMPETDGIELLGRMRELSPSTPVCVMTGTPYYCGMDVRKTARQMGARGVLTKPFEVDALMRMVEHALAPQVVAAPAN